MKCIIFGTESSHFDGTKYNGFKPDACFRSYGELESILEEIFAGA